LAAGPYANQVQDALREFEEQKYVSRKKQIVPGLARQFA
jgi:inorganic pyrophosphatase/exopolyphosphatase